MQPSHDNTILIKYLSASASAQVATHNSLALHLSNSTLSFLDYQQVVDASVKAVAGEAAQPAKQFLVALPNASHAFGDNRQDDYMVLQEQAPAGAGTMEEELRAWTEREALNQAQKRSRRKRR